MEPTWAALKDQLEASEPETVGEREVVGCGSHVDEDATAASTQDQIVRGPELARWLFRQPKYLRKLFLRRLDGRAVGSSAWTADIR